MSPNEPGFYPCRFAGQELVGEVYEDGEGVLEVRFTNGHEGNLWDFCVNNEVEWGPKLALFAPTPHPEAIAGLPVGCPQSAWFSRVWGFCWNHDPDQNVEREVEIHPKGTRDRLSALPRPTAEGAEGVMALLKEARDALKGAQCGCTVMQRMSGHLVDCTLSDKADIIERLDAALAPKPAAKEGEGTPCRWMPTQKEPDANHPCGFCRKQEIDHYGPLKYCYPLPVLGDKGKAGAP